MTDNSLKVIIKNSFLHVSGDQAPDAGFLRQGSDPGTYLRGASHSWSPMMLPRSQLHGITEVLGTNADEGALELSDDEVEGAGDSEPQDQSLGSSGPFGEAKSFPKSSDNIEILEVPPEWEGKTTAMIRNLSFKCNETMLRRALKKAGFKNLFDFIHMPIYRQRFTSKGYAFVNFKDPQTAYRFKVMFDSTIPDIPGSKKLLEVIPANIQGLQANSRAAVAEGSTSSGSSPFHADLEEPKKVILSESHTCYMSSSAAAKEHESDVSLRRLMTLFKDGSAEPPSFATSFALPHHAHEPALVGQPVGSGGSERWPAWTEEAKSQDDSPNDAGAPIAQESSAPPFCFACGNRRIGGHAFCQYCGVRFPAPQVLQ
eukprot:TRINITY_DN21720_c0_g1_i1.p1 TRINITY_DN21720_c0_g1~~TRINITY_DN21720_c0_g1_i1.p1  ORF type:complete len:392 (+),score=56.07 TRINITY_DN21720_c0_g1_i1:65-1177(+)